MNGKYVGYVAGHDPLHDFLSKIMRDRLEVREPQPAFRVFRLSGSNVVYAYEEKFSGVKVICKFYGTEVRDGPGQGGLDGAPGVRGLKTLRRYNLVGSPHHVIRPLGLQPRHQRRAGRRILFRRGIQPRDRARDAAPGRRAPVLAAEGAGVLPRHPAQPDGQRGNGRFRSRLPVLRHGRRQAQETHRIGQRDIDELSSLRDRWRDRPQMWQDQQVWLHGDATPANFLFGHGMDVAAIDLERMKRGDRMFDVGRVAGELQHAFMRDSGDRHRAEPFIGHFLWEYSCHFPDRQQHVRVDHRPRAVLHGAEPAADRAQRLHRPGLRRKARDAGEEAAASRLSTQI
jgi:hypothetical protein